MAGPGSSAKEVSMHKTIVSEEELLDQAERLTGVNERSVLIREALTALIERESAKKLARLGGSEPQLQDVPRRRIEPA